MDTQTVPRQPGMLSRWAQLSGGVSKKKFLSLIPSLSYLKFHSNSGRPPQLTYSRLNDISFCCHYDWPILEAAFLGKFLHFVLKKLLNILFPYSYMITSIVQCSEVQSMDLVFIFTFLST